MKPIVTAIAAGTIAAAAAVTSFGLGIGNSTDKITADLTLLTSGELTTVHFTSSFEENLSEKERIVYEILEKGTSSFTHRMDISSAGYTDTDELSAFLERVFNTKLLWIGIDDTVTYTVTNGIITEITLNYTSSESMLTALAGYTPTKNEVDHALADIKRGMSDVEKALILHDYIVREVDYNNDVANGLEGSPDVYTLKGVFVDRNAVCQGYALAYSYLLDQVGIESMVLGSDAMNHAWNLVKIDGNWYHVDATWDDPTNGVEVDFCRGGYISHEYFLRSDKEMIEELGHYGWVIQNDSANAPKASVSNAFDGWCFRPITESGEEGNVGMLNYVDGYYYTLPTVFGGSEMVKSKIDGSGRKTISLPRDYEYMFYYDGYLYASTSNYVSELTLDGRENRIVAASTGLIRNFWLKQDVLAYYEVDPSGNASKVEVDLERGASNLIEKDEWVFVIDRKGEATLAEYKGRRDETVVIPSAIGKYPVTHIGSAVFKNNKTIQKVVVPEGVVSIGDEAFMYTNISDISLPNSLRTIGQRAFFNCNYFKEFSIPCHVEEIGQMAFYACYGLTTAYFHGNAPKTWGGEVFGKIEDQLVIRFTEGANGWTEGTWVSPDGISHKTATFAPVMKTIEKDGLVFEIDTKGEAKLIEYKGRRDETVKIPATISNYPVTAIGSAVFKQNETVKKISVPEGVTTIGDEAFMQTNLSEIELPDTLITIGNFAFYNCNYFKDFSIPMNVTEIGQKAFYACYNLTTVYFYGNAPTVWGGDVFGKIEGQLTIKYADGASGWTEGTWVSPDGIGHNSSPFAPVMKVIEKDGFVFAINTRGEAELTGYTGEGGFSLTIPSSVDNYPVTSIGSGVFDGNETLNYVTVPEGVKSIGYEAFKQSSFRKITLPNSLETIGDYAFYNCNYCEEFIIPKRVHTIGSYAFYACFDLEDVYFHGDVPKNWGTEVFGRIEDEIEIEYLNGRKGWTDGYWTDPEGVRYESEPFGELFKDMNNDNILNSFDAAFLGAALLHPGDFDIPDNVDLDYNADGITDESDAAFLLWTLFE